MEIRKIQKTGGGSYSITLPKDWIEANDLKEQSEVRISVRASGGLIVTPEGAATSRAEKVYDITGLSLEEIKRELISLYILGYETILITCDVIPKETRLKIRRTLQVLLGLEITEESSKHILVRNILNLDRISFAESTANMYRMVQTMLEDAIKCFTEDSAELAHDVIERDYEIDRLYFLAIRQNHSMLQDIALEETLGQTLTGAHYHESIAVQLERIADHTVKVAKAALESSNRPKSISTKTATTAKTLLKLLDELADCSATIDRQQAHRLLDGLIAIPIDKLHSKTAGEHQIEMALIGDSLTRIHGYMTNLAEIIIDHSFA